MEYFTFVCGVLIGVVMTLAVLRWVRYQSDNRRRNCGFMLSQLLERAGGSPKQSSSPGYLPEVRK